MGEEVPPKLKTLRQLAQEAGLEHEEALLALWDAGIEQVDDLDSKIPSRMTRRVRSVLGVPDAREFQTVAYWQGRWQMTAPETRGRMLSEFGINVGPNARVLPKGAVKRLTRDLKPEALDSPASDGVGEVEREPEYRWECRGHCRSIEFLSYEELVRIHNALVEDFKNSGDPIEPSGVMSENLLGSAAFRPQTSLGGEVKYKTVEWAAAALLHSLVHNHCFRNGNKRTGVVGLLVMLDRNDVLLTCSEQDLFRHVLRVAQHRLVPKEWSMRDDREVMAIGDWIITHSRPIQRGDRILRWRELRHLLTNLGCEVSQPIPGNKVKIRRVVKEQVFLNFKRDRQISITAGYRNAGQEVEPASLTRIRHQLQLDDDHGYDSAYFYGSDKRQPDEFIAEYRTLLRRLARL